MAFKLPPITVLPGGRKVRDYDHLTVEYQEEQKAAEDRIQKVIDQTVEDYDEALEKLGKPQKKKAASKPKAEEEPEVKHKQPRVRADFPAKAEDESLG
jgi:DNA-binding transcriptional regulator GbsR (MarR family)